MTERIFVTGGAGYIGSHTSVKLLENNYEIMIYDNLKNSSNEVIKRIELLTGKKINFVVGDIRNENLLFEAMSSFRPSSVIHFAGLKAVSESIRDPLVYYDVNLGGSIKVLRVMEKVGCNKIVFSSSATVYDGSNVPPYRETDSVLPISPYGQTKLLVEQMLSDWVVSNDENKAVILRYFNPVGAHPSGLIGENSISTPENLMPHLAQVAQKQRDCLLIYGADYHTRDGTGERDYIHVVDLADGHLKAIEKISLLSDLQILNLGTGKGTTVRELITAFEQTNKVKISTKIVDRRPGDVAKSYADNSLAYELIGFKCNHSIEEMCFDTWNWQTTNPYDEKC